MDRIIQHINAVSGVTASELSEVRQNFGKGALGVSPIPLLRPKSSLAFAQSHWVAPVGLNLVSRPDPSDRFWIPTDPQINISGGNKIVKREIANGAVAGNGAVNGTVKELWRSDDYKVTLAGVLMTDDNNPQSEYREVGDQMRRLVELLSAKEALIVTCEVLNDQFGITRLVVDSFEFPATDGTDNQVFTITCYSDESYNLLTD